MITQDAVVFLNTVSPDGETDWFQYNGGYVAEITLKDDSVVTTTNFTTIKESVNYADLAKVNQVVKRVFTFNSSTMLREIKHVRILANTSIIIAEYSFAPGAELFNNLVIVNSNEGLKLEHCLVRFVRSEPVTMYSDTDLLITLGPIDQGGRAPFAEGFVAQSKALVFTDGNSAGEVVNVKSSFTSNRISDNTFENEFVVTLNPPDSFIAPFKFSQIKKLVLGTDNVVDPGTVTWEFTTPIIKDPTKTLKLSCKYQEIVEIYD